MGFEVIFLGGKLTGNEANHSSPSSAEFKNKWSHTSALPIRLHGMRKGNFYIYDSQVIKLAMVRWARHVIRKGEKRTYRGLSGKT
jgi:hypothetical protein